MHKNKTGNAMTKTMPVVNQSPLASGQWSLAVSGQWTALYRSLPGAHTVSTSDFL